MTEFVIEDTTEIPSVRRGTRTPKYPWPQLEAGKNVLIPCEEGEVHKRRRAIYSTARAWFRSHRPELTVIVRPEMGEEVETPGVRVYVVETEG